MNNKCYHRTHIGACFGCSQGELIPGRWVDRLGNVYQGGKIFYFCTNYLKEYTKFKHDWHIVPCIQDIGEVQNICI